MYHGYGFRNRNGTRKLIDYKRGQNYIPATEEYCWRQAKQKYLVKKKSLHTKKGKRIIKLLLLM